MPVIKKEKLKKPRAKRAPAAKKSKKGLKQKQKQKQVVNVQVSAGGSGGGGYVPIPQSPEINYSLLQQLIRPAATTDVPIRAAAPVPVAPVRLPEMPNLAEDLKPKRKYTKKPKPEIAVAEGYASEIEPMSANAIKPPFDISRSGAFSQREAQAMLSSELEGPFEVTAIKGKKGQKGRFEIGNPELGSRSFQQPQTSSRFGDSE